MRRLALSTSVATIVTLNIVIWMGLTGYGESFTFGLMLAVLHVVVPISTILLLVLLVKDHRWAAACVFGAVVVGMLVILALRVASIHLSGGVHLATDVAALNIYLIAVPWYHPKGVAKA